MFATALNIAYNVVERSSLHADALHAFSAQGPTRDDFDTIRYARGICQSGELILQTLQCIVYSLHQGQQAQHQPERHGWCCCPLTLLQYGT